MGWTMGRAAAAFLFAGAALFGFQSGPQLIHDGKFEEALAVFRRGIEAAPKSVADNNGAGVALDLLGQYEEARKYLAQAIKAAGNPGEKVLAQRAMAVSYGFSRECKGAEKYDRSAYELLLGAEDYFNAGEVADELGRICLDAGDLVSARYWYQKGYEAGIEEENMARPRKDLWDFRWAHARARIAARGGKFDEARKYVAAAKTIFEKGTNPAQDVYLAYLQGYVSFYAGDYRAALEELSNALQSDPFIQCLIAQCYEKLGERDKAREYYKMAAGATAHSVPVAFARPFALGKLN